MRRHNYGRHGWGGWTHAPDRRRGRAPAANGALDLCPGDCESPLDVVELALQKNADAIVALGVILQGETAHAHHLGQVVTSALQHISLEFGVPVIHAVLSLKDEAQAKKRCLEDEHNRGTEAARAAFGMANLIADLRK